MIKSVTFTDNYELPLEKESQKQWGTKTYKPSQYTREKKPWTMFKLFKKGLHIDFTPGLNVIVGENGSGKSTLFGLIKHYAGEPPDKKFMFLTDLKTDEEHIEYHRKNYRGELQITCEDPENNNILSFKNTVFFDAEKDNPIVAIPGMINPDRRDFIGLAAELFNAQEESHGESMLPVLKYILQNARNCTVFMDEPDTALSLRNQMWLSNALNKSVQENHNQIIISTHCLALIQNEVRVFDMQSRKWVNTKDYLEEMLNDK